MTTPDDLAELRECYEIVLKTARRCARDLRHATDNIDDLGLRQMFTERYAHYDLVLGGTTDYRVRVHQQLKQLERELQRERKYRETGIAQPNDSGEPF